MTLTEKARAYDKAIELAKSYYNKGTNEFLDTIFPELKDTEDEIIRKELYSFISSVQHSYLCANDKREKRLSYLERQKEQNGEEDKDFTIYHPLKNEVKGEYECFPYSFYGSLTSFSENKDLIDFLRTCFYTEEECNEWIKNQKEQKQKCSINFDHKLNEFEACMLRYLQSAANRKDDAMVIIDTKGYEAQLMEIAKKEQKPLSTEETELNSLAFLEQMGYTCIPPEKEQKPKRERKKPKESWLSKSKYELTHEEELLIKRQKELSEIRALKNKERKPTEWSEEEKAFLKVAIAICNRYSHKDIADWLKSLRPQPKRESYEEDNVIKNVVSYLNGEYGFNTHYDEDAYRRGLVRQLKSLQPHWKPSEEQMRAVFDASERNDKLGFVLRNLYDDLKKL